MNSVERVATARSDYTSLTASLSTCTTSRWPPWPQAFPCRRSSVTASSSLRRCRGLARVRPRHDPVGERHRLQRRSLWRPGALSR